MHAIWRLSTLVTICGTILSGTNSVAHANAKTRVVMISRGAPVVMAKYDDTGSTASYGDGISLSGSWRNVTLNLTALPSTWFVTLGAQINGGVVTSVVGLYKNGHDLININAAGLVSAGKTLKSAGGLIQVAFHPPNDKGHQLVFKADQVNIKSAGGALPFKVDGSGFVTVSDVPDTPLRISIRSTDHPTWNYTLYPYLRGASVDLAAYDVNEVDAGGSLIVNPQ